jgi:hypothetical protein
MLVTGDRYQHSDRTERRGAAGALGETAALLVHLRGRRCGRKASLGRSAPPSRSSREIRGFGMTDSSRKVA